MLSPRGPGGGQLCKPAAECNVVISAVPEAPVKGVVSHRGPRTDTCFQRGRQLFLADDSPLKMTLEDFKARIVLARSTHGVVGRKGKKVELCSVLQGSPCVFAFPFPLH